MAKRRGRKRSLMSKRIKLTDEEIQELQREFYEKLVTTNMHDGKISFNKVLPSHKESKTATVEFSGKAFAKMVRLVADFTSEVAWHGIVHRDEEDPSKFFVEDILVYPQKVTGSTVNTDQDKYEQWLYALDDDQFNNLRMQGHSHVSFGTTPSGVDIAHQEGIISQLKDDMFYIFMIWNKRLERTIMIYDYKYNIFYENRDITVPGMETDFLVEARKKVESTRYSGYGSAYGGSGWTPDYKNDSKPKTETKEAAGKAESPEKDNKKIEVVPASATVKEDAKSTDKPEQKTLPKGAVMGAGWRGAQKSAAKEDDEDNTCFGTLLDRLARM